MKLVRMILLAAPLIGAACAKNPLDSVCPADRILHSLEVTATDSISGALVPNAVIVASGPTTDSVSIGSNVSAYPAFLGGPVGVYSVTIRALGYFAWTRSENVTFDSAAGCQGGLPLAVTARLQPSP